jgi:hypothetical protein
VEDIMKIKITIIGHTGGQIPPLKAIRTVSGLGLAAAKDVLDATPENPKEITARDMTLSEALYELDRGNVTYRAPTGKLRLQQRLRGLTGVLTRHLPRAGLGVPVYVTRKNADGIIATWSVNALIAIAILLVLEANILLWSIVGLYQAARVIVGW